MWIAQSVASSVFHPAALHPETCLFISPSLWENYNRVAAATATTHGNGNHKKLTGERGRGGRTRTTDIRQIVPVRKNVTGWFVTKYKERYGHNFNYSRADYFKLCNSPFRKILRLAQLFLFTALQVSFCVCVCEQNVISVLSVVVAEAERGDMKRRRTVALLLPGARNSAFSRHIVIYRKNLALIEIFTAIPILSKCSVSDQSGFLLQAPNPKRRCFRCWSRVLKKRASVWFDCGSCREALIAEYLAKMVLQRLGWTRNKITVARAPPPSVAVVTCVGRDARGDGGHVDRGDGCGRAEGARDLRLPGWLMYSDGKLKL